METSWQIKKHVKSWRHVNGRMFFGSLQSKGPKESCESISYEEMSSDESEALSSGGEFVPDNNDSDSSSSSSQNAADVEIVDPPKNKQANKKKLRPVLQQHQQNDSREFIRVLIAQASLPCSTSTTDT